MIIQYSPNDPNKPIALASIRIDGGTQSRAGVSEEVVADYAAAMTDGARFPLITVFHDGEAYWLADGFHRYHAFIRNGVKTVAADVHQGDRRDAILYSVGANASHGLRRTNEDKRRAVTTLLQDVEWSKWSDREIARRCGVSDKTVAAARKDTAEFPQYENRTFVHPKTGQATTMNTTSIGKPVQNSGYEDRLTEEDFANDPGIQSAVEALKNAKALYDEVQAMPTAEPPTPEREAQWKQAFGTVEDRSNLMAVINATKLLDKLPDPEAVAASVPPTMMHAVDIVAVVNLSNWFEKFARAWERRKGDPV